MCIRDRRETAGVYHECGEMDLNRTFDLLIEYTVARDRDLNLVLEIHDRDLGQVIAAAGAIRAELLERAARR